MSNRIYMWITAGIIAGAALALVVPGLNLGFGIAIGTAIGIAGAASRISGQRHTGLSARRRGERSVP
jgi:hypothetical protein